ncbi:MAG: serine/threonine protein kinase [Lachnospiraceae bacterium]|nr:serine/threonine protein kinase [Lachnospiraceae bacterium]
MLQIGSLVDGKYKILNEIGHGGMSVVYMAINEKANKTWAVKEVRKNGVLDYEAVRQGLIVETNMLKRLKHKNLPSIIDVIENEDAFLIVMDYIEGKSLADILAEEGAQPQEFVIEWAKQLCDTLEYLHTRTPAIIYRDLKPANIMVKPDGNITLIDFGTAREYKEKNIADTTCLGTVGYAAPEQFGGMGQTDARTDIYCLGATLYHLITGNNPSDPPYEIRNIREINPALSSGLEKIITKCTQRNPDDRFQSCAELAYALENYEKADDEYKAKQMQKFVAFIAMLFATVVFGVSGIVTQRTAILKASDNYQEVMEEAAKTVDYDKKIELYEKGIGITDKAGDETAYVGLIRLFKEDGKFDKDEQEKLVKLIMNNQAALKKDLNQYVNVCFETGKLYWYYYDEGNGENNSLTRMKSAVEWFRDVLDNAPPEYENLGMAKVYASIGKFYAEIAIDSVEGNDKGKYAPFFADLVELTNEVLNDDAESEIVKLELMDLARGAMQQYGTRFKGEGITKDQQTELYELIKNSVEGMNATTEVTQNLKDTIMEHLEDTRQAIELAYGT